MSAITIIASADHAGKGPGAAVEVTEFALLRLDFAVTSANTTARPILDVRLETSSDGSTGWYPIHEFRSVNGVDSQRVVINNHDAFVRANWLCRSMSSGAEPACVWAITGDAIPSP